jgi:hypothetical protein
VPSESRSNFGRDDASDEVPGIHAGRSIAHLTIADLDEPKEAVIGTPNHVGSHESGVNTVERRAQSCNNIASVKSITWHCVRVWRAEHAPSVDPPCPEFGTVEAFER